MDKKLSAAIGLIIGGGIGILRLDLYPETVQGLALALSVTFGGIVALFFIFRIFGKGKYSENWLVFFIGGTAGFFFIHSLVIPVLKILDLLL